MFRSHKILTYYAEEDTIRIVLFLWLKLAGVFSLCVQTLHLDPHCQVGHGTRLWEATATIRGVVFKPRQAFGSHIGVDLTPPLSAKDLVAASVHTEQDGIFPQDRCDIAGNLQNGNFFQTWDTAEQNLMRTWFFLFL